MTRTDDGVLVSFSWILTVGVCSGCTGVSAPYVRSQEGHLLPLPSMRYIAGGEFTMGDTLQPSDSKALHRDEVPRRKKVQAFYLAQFPVTNEEFCVFLNATKASIRPQIRNLRPSGHVWEPTKDRDRLPVIVSYVTARSYCEWLADVSGLPFRMPTEIEWEYAARGPASADWPWRGSEPRLERPVSAQILIARGWRWLDKRGTVNPADLPLATPVGMFPRGQTPEGVYGLMASQVGEWCQDRYVPQHPETCYGHQRPEKMRVIRGGYHRRREQPTINWLLLFTGDGAVSTHHDARTWTRIGGDEENDAAMLRLALDADSQVSPS